MACSIMRFSSAELSLSVSTPFRRICMYSLNVALYTDAHELCVCNMTLGGSLAQSSDRQYSWIAYNVNGIVRVVFVAFFSFLFLEIIY